MRVAIDIETNAPVNDTITSLWLQWSDNDRALVVGNDIAITIAALANNTSITDYIFHFAQFDLNLMGEEFRQKTYGRIRDTGLMSRARGEINSSLKHLGNYYTARPGNYAWLQPGTKFSFDDETYGAEDIEVTWQLFKRWESELDKPVVELMNRAVVMAACQTHKGSAIDLQALDTLAISGKVAEQELRQVLIDRYGCEPTNDNLVDALNAKGYSLTKKTKGGKEALDDTVLEELGLTDILDWRHAAKLDSSFIGKMKSLIRPDGMMPHEQKMMNAKTGRSTMKDYNWQQVPRKGPVKGLLVSRFEGGLIGSVDLSQAELRVACYLSGDEAMAEWLQMTDAHRFNASMAFNVPFDEVTDEQRTDAKSVVFRLLYGGSAITDGQKRVEQYLRGAFKKFFQWHARTVREATTNLSITDYFGKTCGLKQIKDQRGKWAVGRAGVNSPIQGLASHLSIHITVNMWELFRKHKLQSLVLMGIHDSVILDVHPDEVDIVTKITQQAFRSVFTETPIGKIPMASKLPMTGELLYGVSWADTKNGTKILCSTLGD